jgi:putative Mg2+ transporter-C (MgtC) family protein
MTINEIIDSLNSSHINMVSAIFKLMLALLAGGLIGMNRERHKQPAGFRTHILICLGSTLLMILSIYIPQTYFDFKNGDPGRIAAQVVSGIGFLGAGAIIRLGSSIRGITTAASIWLISAIGLCIGAGLFTISAVTVAFALFTLVILEKVEHKWFPQMLVKTLLLEFNQQNIPEESIKDLLNKLRIHISDFDITISTESSLAQYKAVVKIPDSIEISKLIHKLNKLDNIKTIKIS